MTTSEDALGQVLDELRHIRRDTARSEEELWDAVDEIRQMLRHSDGGLGAETESRDNSDSHRLTPSEYRRLKRRLRRFAAEALPEGAQVAVLTRGDEQLLDLPGVVAGHYPRDPAGGYAGFYPADGTAAVANLEWARANGADYLLFPATATWWLEAFPRLARHLRRRYRVVAREDDVGVVYGLAETGADGVGHGEPLADLLDAWEGHLGRAPALLDWGTGRELASRLPGRSVFSPPSDDRSLPYLDASVDVVALSGEDPRRMAEARRVAAHTVVRFPESWTGNGDGLEITPGIEHVDGPPPTLPSVSVIIPTYNGIAHLAPCVRGLASTLSRDFNGEVLIVDDGSGPETTAGLERLEARHPWLRVVRSARNGGFIASCNRGAREAQGEYLVFLNDDTVPLPGWLGALLRTFVGRCDAGAVGGRLVYPDGSLQEAGGIIYRDGSGANFGRGDYQVDASVYRHLRRVDYCSGALLATPRSLFNELGGFDRRYRPAYYEDTDYCFQVRAEGLGVYYQPEATVVHTEGATSGTDTGSGVKRHQLRNQKTFRQKWAHVLEGFPEPPASYDGRTWARLALAGRTS